MPPLLVLDITAQGLSTVIAGALALLTIAAGLDREANRWFLAFCGVALAHTVLSLLLRISLWYRVGHPMLLGELVSLTFTLFGPMLLAFAVRQTSSPRRWFDVIAFLTLGACGILVFPLLDGRLVSDARLTSAGATVMSVSPWGILAGVPPGLTMALAALLFWTKRDAPARRVFALSTLLLLAAYAVDGVLSAPLPVLSLATLVALSALGWGLAGRQVFNPLRERSERLELIARLGKSATALLDVDELLSQAATLVRDAFRYFSVAILLVEGDELVLQASTMPQLVSGPRRRLAVGREGITGWVAATGEPANVPDVRLDSRYLALSDAVKTRSELAVPIRHAGKVIGVLDAQSVVEGAFGEIDVFTLQTVADQLAVAIANARLYEQATRRAERLALAGRISAAVSATLDLGDLLEIVQREITPVFHADAILIALYDVDRDELDYRVQVDEGVREPPSREAVGPGFTSRVVREKRSLLVRDVAAELATLPKPLVWGTGKIPLSWLGVPMLLAGELVGVICVQTYRGRRYGDGDRQLLASIADQVAVAIENARLYETAMHELAERERTARVLRESEAQFRNLAEQSPNMIFIFGGRRFLYANRRSEAMMGWPREISLAPGFSWHRVIAPECRMAVTTHYRRQLRGEETGPVELTLVTREGQRIDAILTTSLIQYGGVRALLGVITDITARKRTERFLQSLNLSSLAMMQSLAADEIIPMALRALAGLGFSSAVLIADSPTGRLVPRWTGDPSGTVVSRGGQAAGPGLAVEAVAVLARVTGEAETVLAELEGAELAAWRAAAATPPGRADVARVIFTPLHVGDERLGVLAVEAEEFAPDDQQAVTAFAHVAAAAWRKAILMDDLEQSLRELRSTQEQLLHAQKMEAIGRLAGGIAHDFNNLLTVVSGYADLLADTVHADAEALGDVGEIKNAIRRAAALTSRLLAFSRKQVLRLEVLDPNAVVAGSEKLLRPLIGEDIELVVGLTPDPGHVRADRYQLEQIIINLAVNARDAMPGGGRLEIETASVEIGADDPRIAPDLPPGPWVVLTVRDSGSGMSEEVQRHLFEPFFTTKEDGKGTGLGLSTVYGIVKQSGGAVRVVTAAGQGTSFTIWLPRVSGSSVLAVPSPDSGTRRQGSGTVLVVEDDVTVRGLAERILADAGYRVVSAGSPSEAIRRAEEVAGDIEVLLTDVVMPGGLSGVDLAERLCLTRPRMEVVFMSGYTQEAALRAGVSRGELRFLAKPFTAAELLAAIADALAATGPSRHQRSGAA